MSSTLGYIITDNQEQPAALRLDLLSWLQIYPEFALCVSFDVLKLRS